MKLFKKEGKGFDPETSIEYKLLHQFYQKNRDSTTEQ